MRGIGGSTLRGGQTVFHGIRMWGQLFQAAMLFAAFMTVAVPAWTLWNRTTGAEWYAAGMVTLAESKLVAWLQIRIRARRCVSPTARGTCCASATSPPRSRRCEAREKIKAEMFASAWPRRDGRRRPDRAVPCRLLVSRRAARPPEAHPGRGDGHRAPSCAGGCNRPMLRLLAAPAGRQTPQALQLSAGIPYPERTETQHTIVSGTTGSGKTVLISDLVSQIRARGERCVIYDKMGSYTRAFFDPERDVLMNPLDARAPRWSPFLEARNPRDFDMMAAALIPQQKDTVDPFWVTAARQLFSNGAGGVLEEGGDRATRSWSTTAQDRPDRARQGHGRHGRAVDRRSGEPEDRALGARHADRPPRRWSSCPIPGKPFSIRDWISQDEDRAAGSCS